MSSGSKDSLMEVHMQCVAEKEIEVLQCLSREGTGRFIPKIRLRIVHVLEHRESALRLALLHDRLEDIPSPLSTP